MSFQRQRLVGLRKAKGIRTQEDLETISGIDRSMLNKYEKGTATPTADVLETLARKLDAEMGYFHGLGDYYEDSALGFIAAAIEMSYAAFKRDLTATAEQKEWCRRVLRHNAAPRTSAGWKALVEMIGLATEPAGPSASNFGLLEGGKQ
jgi:transcriptional regulator with XRE-family HTH domain